MEKLFYQSILNHTEYEIPKIKWSRFIWNVFHIKNKEEAENFIKEISNKYRDATHNCFAYTYWANINFDLFWNLEITADNFRQSDDWEPANTAWKPILAQIQGQKLHNILIVVTRYFWWTLLWVWWLIQAYSECAKQTILHSKIEEVELTQEKTISFDYENMSLIMNLLNKYNAKITKENHWNTANITFEINKWFLNSFSSELTDLSKGKISLN